MGIPSIPAGTSRQCFAPAPDGQRAGTGNATLDSKQADSTGVISISQNPMSLFVILLLLIALVSFASAADAVNPVVLFRQVTFMGETFNVPYSNIPDVKKNVTTLFIAEKSKLPFVLNTAISILKHSGGVGAFSILCVDCKRNEAEQWGKRGIHLIGSKFLQDMSIYAFRKDGPMPYTASSPEGDMRRHSVHMLYREWIKATLLENGLSVLLADIDISFNSSLPFFTAKEDVVLEGD